MLKINKHMSVVPCIMDSLPNQKKNTWMNANDSINRNNTIGLN